MLSRLIENMPEGFDPQKCDKLVRGHTTSICPKLHKLVVETYASLPDRKISLRRITDEEIAQLNAEAERTGIGPTRLVSMFTEKIEGMNESIATQIFDGRKRNNVDESHIKLFFNEYSKYRDSYFIEIDSEKQQYLISEKVRTGFSPQKLYDQFLSSVEDLNAQKVIRIVNGYTVEIKRDHLDAIENAYKELPAKQRAPKGASPA